MNNKANIRVVQHQSEEIHQNNEVSESEKEALLAKYYPEYFKQQNGVDPKTNKPLKKKNQQPVPLEKRDGSDDLQKSTEEYVDVKYSSVSLEGEPYQDTINFKIEIRSDMKF